MNVHKHFINTPLAPPFFYSNRGCFVSLEIYQLSGKLAVRKARKSGAYQKVRIGREMRAYKNFILSSHMRRNWALSSRPTGCAHRELAGAAPSGHWARRAEGKPSAGAGLGAARRRNRFLPRLANAARPIGKAPSRVQGRDFSRSRAKPSLQPSALRLWGRAPEAWRRPGAQRARGGLEGRRSCRHSLAIGLADSGCRSGRHTFKKFYFKKTIINNISRQKKHTFAMIKGYKMIILRPLLKFSRFEFLKFCEFWYLPIVPDFTNFNVCFRRNNLRLQFIPYLKIFLNLNLSQKIDQFQQILKLENQYLQLILKKIHGGTFYGETPGLLDRPPKGGLGRSGRALAPQGHLAMARCCGARYPSVPGKLDPRLPLGLPTLSFTPSKSSAELGCRPLCGDGREGAIHPSPWGRGHGEASRPRHHPGSSPRVRCHRPSTFGEATKGFQGAPLGLSGKPSAPSPWRMRPPSARLSPNGLDLQAQLPASAGGHHKAKPSRLGANAVSGKFSLCTKPDGKRLSTHVSPKSWCFLQDFRKNYFFYFPKIFQYLIIHNFYYLVSKKISFNEISCIFQKLKPQSKSK